MDIKQKRKLIIWIFIGIGFFLPLLAMSLINISNDIAVTMLCISLYLSGTLVTLVSAFIRSGVVTILTFITVQSVIYGGIGYIVARLIFPDKKLPPESGTPSKTPRGDCKKIKYKRLIIIGCCIAWGMISASYFFFKTNPSSDLKSGILSYWYLLCYASTILVKPIFGVINTSSPWGFVASQYFTMQFIIYFFIGWIIARLVYPNKKPLPESTEPPEPDK